MTNTAQHGTPIWYELSTGDLDAAGGFYTSVIGWKIADSGMEGITYHIATAPDGGQVAGLMTAPPGPDGAPPPAWVIYFACDDCEAMAAAITAAGGRVLQEPTDIPGTGRFAICADPQGAMFGILQPLPMDEAPQHPPFDQAAVGHGSWHELMTSDPTAGLAFYAEQFGWTAGAVIDTGEMGNYHLFQVGGVDIGGTFGLADSQMPAWVPYFGTDGVDGAIGRIQSGGGTLHHGPAEVPGGAFVAMATDPQGAWFAVIGPR